MDIVNMLALVCKQNTPQGKEYNMRSGGSMVELGEGGNTECEPGPDFSDRMISFTQFKQCFHRDYNISFTLTDYSN